MRILLFKTITTLIAVCVLTSISHAGETNTADVVVYGSTPGGFCAAIAAAREGASVILLEPTGHIGGMNTGGLSFSDSNQMYRETLMGLFHEWHLRIQQDYEDRGITLPYNVNVKDQTHWSYEPHVAFRVTTQMLAEAGVEVLTRRWLGSVNTNGVHIESLVTTSNDTFIADTFVDGSYEGDLMAAAGVSWTIGREGTADFGESRAGKRYPKSMMNIDGFDGGGDPLPLITTTNAGATDAGDDNIMTYSFRLSLTTSAGNKIPMPAPDNYDSNRFEVVRRYVQEHGASSVGFDSYSVPGSKVDGNNSIGKQFSLGLVGGGKGWAEADEAGRAALFEAYKQYTLEFLYFLSNDPVFSASEQADVSKWGLCADEFPDTGHFSPYLYVRESRRMQGMYVITENDIIDDPVKDDPIMVSSFPIDSHDCQRIAYPGGGVRNEGTIYPVKPSGSNKGYPYHVPYRAILPLSNQCDNLLVPVALSCTHVAISSLRIEGTWMLIGQSAGIAAAMAADQDVAVQDLPYTNLQPRLLAQGQVLELPDGFQPPEPLTGIVLDDPDAELAGTWGTSTTFTPYVGDGYRYAGAAATPNDGSSVATWRFTAGTGGVYQLNMAYSPDPTRATNVPLIITSGAHVSQFSVDQTIARPVGSVVRSIGTVELVSGTESTITVSTSNTTGFVILDAIQLVQDAPAAEKPSVLFINVDDWNDWNEVLQGHSQAITPNIERLAERGVVFNNAICASPMCFPSRNALFSGIHPARSGNIANDNNINSWRTYTPDAVTIPKHFSNQGWQSIGIAKNFHNGDDPEFDEYIPKGGNPAEVPGSGINLNPSGRWAYSADPTTEMADYIAVSQGIDRLTSVDEPLFLALGIYRPHVPWVVPEEYFNLYPLEDVQYPVHQTGDVDDLPERLQLLARGEAKFGPDYNDMLVAEGYDKQFIRAYLACVTFADEQLGRLLDAWDASPHSTNGYIVMWSDHGYMLSEKGAWSKMKPWYDSARCNLIIAGPDIPTNEVCTKAVSLLDLYPTLIDLLDLPSPPQEIDGKSLVPLLQNPDADWDQPVVMSSEADGIRYDTVLGNDYRMTRLITGETELYQLSSDPHEFDNLATNPVYAPVIEDLSQHLTFNYPEIPEDGWVEAEAIPRQSSADYGLRGNCNFPKSVAGASGGQVICADLEAGTTSYIDFVLDVGSAGTYDVGATLSAGGSCTVFVADVVEDVAQADAGYPMTALGSVQGDAGALSDVTLGTVTFDQPGFKLIRFMSNVNEQRVQIDRIQLLEAQPVTTLYFQEGVSPTVAYTHDAVYIRSGDPSTNFNGDSDQELIVGFTQTGEILRGLLEFDISEIAASDQIDSVSLILRTESSPTGLGGDITINVYEYGFDIDETNATWNVPGDGAPVGGSTNGTLLTSATFDATTQNVDVTFGDTEAFRTAVSDALAGDGFLRMILTREGETPDGAHRFARFDDDTVTPAGNRPELVVVTQAAVGEIGTVFVLR